MELQLSERTHAILLETVASGGYASPAEAVDDALRMLRSWQNLKATRLQAELQRGVDQLDRGESRPWSEVRDLIRKRLAARSQTESA